MYATATHITAGCLLFVPLALIGCGDGDQDPNDIDFPSSRRLRSADIASKYWIDGHGKWEQAKNEVKMTTTDDDWQPRLGDADSVEQQQIDFIKQLLGNASEIEDEVTSLLGKPPRGNQFDVLLKVHHALDKSSDAIVCCHQFIQGWLKGQAAAHACVETTDSVSFGLASLAAYVNISLEDQMWSDSPSTRKNCGMVDNLSERQSLFCIVRAVRRIVNLSSKLLKWASSPSDSQQSEPNGVMTVAKKLTGVVSKLVGVVSTQNVAVKMILMLIAVATAMAAVSRCKR